MGAGAIRTTVAAGAIALVSTWGSASAQQPVEGYKTDAIEALNAVASQPAVPVAPVAPAAVAPAPVAAEKTAAPVPPAAAASAPSAAAPEGAPEAAPDTGNTAPQRLSDTIPLKKENTERLQVGQEASQGLSLTGLAFACAVLGLAALLAWWYQKRTVAKRAAGGVDTTIEVLSSTRVAGRFQVSLVRVPGAILVLGVSDKGLTLLTELPPDALLPAPYASSGPFDRSTGAPARPAGAQTRETRRAQAAPMETEPVRATARRPDAPSAATRDSSEFLEQLLRVEQQQQALSQQQTQQTQQQSAAVQGPDGMVEGEQIDIRRRLQRYQQGGLGGE